MLCIVGLNVFVSVHVCECACECVCMYVSTCVGECVYMYVLQMHVSAGADVCGVQMTTFSVTLQEPSIYLLVGLFACFCMCV